MDEYFGRYQLNELIGEGGTGSVYLAYDPSLSRRVAIKILRGKFNEFASKRFERELQATAQLEHRSIVSIYDFGEIEGQRYYVMRYMAGGSLRNRLDKLGAFTPKKASEFLNPLASALDFIHQAGLVHRNIKPSNILLDEQGQPYLGDFSIVHPIETETQAFVGTPAYMSPEQMMGENLDSRTDIYLLGLVLYEMLTLRRPFPGKSLFDIYKSVNSGKVPSLNAVDPNISVDYDRVIFRSLAKNPAERYESAGEMANDFSVLVSGTAKIVLVDPIPNPFVVGNPVSGNLFVGRAEIFSRLKELWGSDASHNVNSVVLFGHRRMGKTSILQNLHRYFGEETIVAGITMQRVGRVRHTGELLGYLALAIYDALVDAGFPGLEEPDDKAYETNGYAAFNRFLREVRLTLRTNEEKKQQHGVTSIFSRLFGESKKSNPAAIKSTRRVILTIDEFELIEEAIADGRVDSEFLDFLRGVIHSEPWLILALAGLHKLEEMTADYWNPLFASVTPVRVSFFSRTATGNLLANPGENFPLTFPNATVDYIYELAQGQPYLTQLLAYHLVSDYNEAVIERKLLRSTAFSLEDVDRIINSSAFYDQGRYYFNGVWGQAEKSGPEGQLAILEVLANSSEPVEINEIAGRTTIEEALMQASLRTLQQHDVVKRLENGRYDFTVPLMGNWIRKMKLIPEAES